MAVRSLSLFTNRADRRSQINSGLDLDALPASVRRLTDVVHRYALLVVMFFLLLLFFYYCILLNNAMVKCTEKEGSGLLGGGMPSALTAGKRVPLS